MRLYRLYAIYLPKEEQVVRSKGKMIHFSIMIFLIVALELVYKVDVVAAPATATPF